MTRTDTAALLNTLPKVCPFKELPVRQCREDTHGASAQLRDGPLSTALTLKPA